MKRIFTVALLISCTCLYGQYIPNNSQTFQFASAFNPAFSGVENFGDLKLSYRYQWTGFGEFAPKFVNLAYNTRIKQPLDMTYNSIRISNPGMMRANEIPRGKRMISGLGVNVFQSSVGVIESIGGGVNFTINYPIVNQFRVSAGAGVFMENRKLDMSEVIVRDPANDPFYNHLLNSSTSQTELNVRAGLLFYTPDFYFGGSYLPLVYFATHTSDLEMEQAFYIATAQMGFSFNVNPDLVLKPSAMALLLLDNSIITDVSLKAYIQEKVWAGLTYRTSQTGIAMVGFNFNQTFSASYSYDFSLGQFQKFNDGSHELVLAMRLNNIKKYTQYTW